MNCTLIWDWLQRSKKCNSPHSIACVPLLILKLCSKSTSLSLCYYALACEANMVATLQAPHAKSYLWCFDWLKLLWWLKKKKKKETELTASILKQRPETHKRLKEHFNKTKQDKTCKFLRKAFLKNVQVLSCFVSLKSVLFNLLCVLDLLWWLTAQNLTQAVHDT